MERSSGRSRLRRWQRWLGLVLLALSGVALFFVWRSALADGHYSRAAAALLPVVSVVGLGLLLFPIDREALPTETGLYDDRVVPQMPLIWQYLLLVAVLAGLANWYALALML
jgi:hypothetical protein